MKKVIILGTGFSKSFMPKLPTTDDLLEAIMFEAEPDFIDDTAKFKKIFFPTDKPNLTDFLSYFDILTNTLGLPSSGVYEKKFKRLIRNYLIGTQLSADKQGVLRQYIKRIIGNDATIVNFNWDLTIERCVDDPKWFIQNQKLIKPHGSVDWVSQNLYSLSSILINKQNEIEPIYRLNDNLKIEQIRGIEIDPCIITPSFNQDFSLLKHVMALGHMAMSQATEIEIIGFSLRSEDVFARLMLRMAIIDINTGMIRADLKSITIIDKHIWCRHLDQRYRQLLCDNESILKFKETDACEYLKAQVDSLIVGEK